MKSFIRRSIVIIRVGIWYWCLLGKEEGGKQPLSDAGLRPRYLKQGWMSMQLGLCCAVAGHVNVRKTHHCQSSLQKNSRGHRGILGDVGESQPTAFPAAGVPSSRTGPRDGLEQGMNREAER